MEMHQYLTSHLRKRVKLVRVDLSELLAKHLPKEKGEMRSLAVMALLSPSLANSSRIMDCEVTYRGSRFNILFENATCVFFLYEQMTHFLEGYGAANRLLKAVLHDLKTPEFLAGVKALGLVGKLVTCPLWMLLEDKDTTIVDMNVKYLQLVSFFRDATESVGEFMTGNLLPFGEDTRISKDVMYSCLVDTSPFDDIVITYLKMLLPSLGGLCKELFKDHLPGGRYEHFSEEEKVKLTSCPKTSQFAESIFGMLDQLLRSKPSITTLAAEAYIMFANNRTLDWIDGKNEIELAKLLQDASKETKALKLSFRQRREEIANNKQRVLAEAIEKRENARREKIRRQEEYTQSIINYGLWQSEVEVDNMLLSLERKTDKIAGLKAQLHFRKHVLLQQPAEKTSFNLTKCKPTSKGRVTLSVEELAENVKKLIREGVVKDSESDTVKHILVGRRVRHRFKEMEGGKEVLTWYKGKIVSQVPGFRDWFNIVYDGNAAVYTYQHLDKDLEEADLQILV